MIRDIVLDAELTKPPVRQIALPEIKLKLVVQGLFPRVICGAEFRAQ
jgi:hypothetical protein